MIAFSKRRCRAKYLKDLHVEEVSLVSEPANLRPFCMLKALDAKDEGADVVFCPLAKAKGDQQVAVGIVYEPDVEDGQGDAASAEEIEKAAHEFMLESQTVGVDHAGEADAAVVESYIAPQDLKLGGEKVRKGSWVMAVKVNDPDLWASIRKGERTGFSMGGRAARETPEDRKDASLTPPKPETQLEKQTPEKPVEKPSITAEDAAKILAANEALQSRVATLEAQAKADAEAKAQAANDQAVRDELAAYVARREKQAQEIQDRIVATVIEATGGAGSQETREEQDGGARDEAEGVDGEGGVAGDDGAADGTPVPAGHVGEERPDEDL